MPFEEKVDFIAIDEIQLAVSNAKSLILVRKQNVNRLRFKIEQLSLSNQRLLISIKKAKKSIEDTTRYSLAFNIIPVGEYGSQDSTVNTEWLT